MMKNKGPRGKSDDTYQIKIGQAVEKARLELGWTQTELAKKVGTSQSAIHRIENGKQNISLDMTKRLSDVLQRQIITITDEASQSFEIHGGKELSGEITINTSKNAAVGLLCASLLNNGKTIVYEPGVISIMPAKVPHEVNAGPEGLYLFAKFFPALC